MAGLDLDTVKHALETARKHGFAEVEISTESHRFSATLLPQPKASQAAGADEPSTEPEFLKIESAFVGYYRATDNVLKVGAHVKSGDVVAIIASLGIANEVESKHTGEIVEVLVAPDQAVEFGQTLALVRPV